MPAIESDTSSRITGVRYNYRHQFAGAESLIDDIHRMLLDGRYVLTEEVREFESAFAAYCGCRRAIGVNSGTDAIVIALRAIGIGRGDRVLTQANTFHATVAAIELAGATPVLSDVNENTFVMDPDEIGSLITGQISAVIPVHLFGKPSPMEAILRMARAHNIHVIEDAAQAHGASIAGKRVGSFGSAACFSFHPSKNLAAAGDGGAIVTNSDEIAVKLDLLRGLGQRTQNEHVLVGFNSKLDALQARILSWKLPSLDAWNAVRRKVAHWYRDDLSHAPLYFQKEDVSEVHAYHLFQVGTPHRDALLEFLASRGIDAVVRYPTPIHLQPAFEKLGYRKGDFPVSERLARELLCLPIRPDMGESEVAFIAGTVRDFFNHGYGRGVETGTNGE